MMLLTFSYSSVQPRSCSCPSAAVCLRSPLSLHQDQDPPVCICQCPCLSEEFANLSWHQIQGLILRHFENVDVKSEEIAELSRHQIQVQGHILRQVHLIVKDIFLVWKKVWKLTWENICSKIWQISCRVWSKLTEAALLMLWLRHTHLTPRHTNAVLASHPCDASSYSCDAASYSFDAFKDQICNIFSDAPSDKSVFWDNQSGSTLKKKNSTLACFRIQVLKK